MIPGKQYLPDGMEDDLVEEILEEAQKRRHVKFERATKENKRKFKKAGFWARFKNEEKRMLSIARGRQEYWRKKYRGLV